MEVGPRQLSSRLTQKLVLLEVAEIDVPPLPSAEGSAPTLYFRIVELSDGKLRVELWERGEFYGARHIAGEGSNKLLSRRIALAAGVLARRLRGRRLAEARLAATPVAAPEQPVARSGFPLFGRLALGARATGAAVGPSDFWMLGPQLAGELRFDSGPALEIGFASLGGTRSGTDGSTLRWTEVSLTPKAVFELGRVDLVAGVTAAAASVRLTASSPEGAARDTWSARGAVLLRLEGAPADSGTIRPVRWSLGPDVGAVLRPVRVFDLDGSSKKLGGLYVGGTVGLVVDPLRPSGGVRAVAETSAASEAVPAP